MLRATVNRPHKRDRHTARRDRAARRDAKRYHEEYHR